MSAPACTIAATVIGCQSLTHCVGCDQCEPTTRERTATTHLGDPDVVRWCDGCAERVNAGESDVCISVDDVP